MTMLSLMKKLRNSLQQFLKFKLINLKSSINYNEALL